jgi:hypothetical protein
MEPVEFSNPMGPMEFIKKMQRKQSAVYSDGICELELRLCKRNRKSHCTNPNIWAGIA